MDDQPDKSLIGIGIVGGIIAVLCCVSPLIPVLLGVGAVSALMGLSVYKPFFIGAAIVFLGIATFLLVRRKKQCCTTGKVHAWKIALWLFGVGAVVYVAFTYAILPSIARIATNNLAQFQIVTSSAEPAVSESNDVIEEDIQEPVEQLLVTEKEETALSDLSTLDVAVDGMYCAGCIVGVQYALLEVDGIEQAEYDWDNQIFTLGYDSSRITEDTILQTELPEPYNMRRTSDPPPEIPSSNSSLPLYLP